MIDARSLAARAALAEIQPGMIVGLGTGDTASRAIVALGESRLPVVAVASSERSAALGRQVGLDVRAPDEVDHIDVTIDGADEIDGALRLLKGGGGALTREKLVARASRKLVIVVDEDKVVTRLGEKRRLPVELVAFGSRWTLARLAQFDPVLREGFVTDNGGVIADCRIPPDADLPVLARELKLVPGVVEHGLFLDEAQVAYIGRAGGVTRLTR